MRQARHEEVDLTFYAANHAKGLATIIKKSRPKKSPMK